MKPTNQTHKIIFVFLCSLLSQKTEESQIEVYQELLLPQYSQKQMKEKIKIKLQT